jgi:hypothetical protein
MKKNRKQSETYRFNGNSYLHPRSIHAVRLEVLQSWINEYEAKLGDPDDPDDKRWTARWLRRFRLEFDKKYKGLTLKVREMQQNIRRSCASAGNR